MDLEELTGWLMLISFVYCVAYYHFYTGMFGSTFDFIASMIIFGIPGAGLLVDYYLKEYYRSVDYKRHFERD